MKKLKSKEETRNLFLSFFLFFVFIFDSGGRLGIRNAGFLIVCLLLLTALFSNKIIFNRSFFLFYFTSLTYLLISLVIAMFNSASFMLANTFNFSLYFLIITYLLARENYLTLRGYLIAIKLFSILVIVFFFGRILNISYILMLFEAVAPYSGADAMKNGMPAVYYQGTLAIVPAAAIFAKKGNVGWFLICLLALAVAPSRFGVLTSLFLFLLIYRKKFYFLSVIAAIVLICLNNFNVVIPVLYDFMDMFRGNSYGVSVRSGHLESILMLFKSNPLILFFGQGPGTVFYTSGFNNYADSVEISHFDFVRKYGIFYFIFLNCGLLFLIFKLYKSGTVTSKQVIYGLIAHYIVAISNPVLTSIPFIMLLGVCIALSGECVLKDEKKNENLFAHNHIQS
jgi:hypothetical protein